MLKFFTLFDVKMIQIWTFPADPSTERVPSLAERVAYLRYPINLRLFNWRVPALVPTGIYIPIPTQSTYISEAFRPLMYKREKQNHQKVRKSSVPSFPSLSGQGLPTPLPYCPIF